MVIPQDVLDALNAVLSGPNATPAQRAKWPRGLGDVLDADPVVTARVFRDADGVPGRDCTGVPGRELAGVDSREKTAGPDGSLTRDAVVAATSRWRAA